MGCVFCFGGFPSSSAGKESTYGAGDPGLISGLGSSPREGIDFLLHYSLASLVPQMVKNPPAIRETWVQSLGWEDSLEEGLTTHSSILTWRIPMARGAWRVTVHGGCKESDTSEQLNTPQHSILLQTHDITNGLLHGKTTIFVLNAPSK